MQSIQTTNKAIAQGWINQLRNDIERVQAIVENASEDGCDNPEKPDAYTLGEIVCIAQPIRIALNYIEQNRKLS